MSTTMVGPSPSRGGSPSTLAAAAWSSMAVRLHGVAGLSEEYGVAFAVGGRPPRGGGTPPAVAVAIGPAQPIWAHVGRRLGGGGRQARWHLGAMW
jgi:hypothetical protein